MQPRYAITFILMVSLGGWLAAVVGAEPAPQLETAPDFTLYQGLNVDTLRLSDFLEYPVLLFFFDAGNMTHARSLPYAREWDRRYRGDGLRTIGVHCPAFEPLKVPRNAMDVVAAAMIDFPVGFDMDWDIYSKYSLDTLPTFMVLKPGGEIVFRASGTRGFRDIEQAIQQLLSDRKPGTILPFLLQPLKPIDDPDMKILKPTPMVFPGYASGLIADCDSAAFGKYDTYTDSGDREKGVIYLQGRWRVDEQTISHEQEVFGLEDHIRLIYSGKDVWILPGFEYGKSPRIYVEQDKSLLPNEIWGRDVQSDRKGRSYISPRSTVPVHVVSNHGFGAHELTLIPAQGDVTLFYLYFEGAVDPQSKK